jgi:hypothetical protein
MLTTLEARFARTLKASAELCVLGTSDSHGLFSLAQAQIATPWYPTSKRQANPEVGP